MENSIANDAVKTGNEKAHDLNMAMDIEQVLSFDVPRFMERIPRDCIHIQTLSTTTFDSPVKLFQSYMMKTRDQLKK